MHNWNDYQYFLAIARQGSLNAAAKILNVAHSTVLRRLNALEAALQTRLFERLGSGYVLTAAGETILSHAERMEEEMLATERLLLGQDIRLSGTLKVSTSDTIGYYWLPRYLLGFRQHYPGIVLDIDITTRQRDLTRREADVALSAASKQPEAMVGRKLQPITFQLYATQRYLAEHGAFFGLEEANGHTFLLGNESLTSVSVMKWLHARIPDTARRYTSNKLTGLYRFCRQHLGIAPLPTYVGEQDETLTPLMFLPADCNSQMWLLTHPDIRYTARVKAFMDYISSQYHQ